MGGVELARRAVSERKPFWSVIVILWAAAALRLAHSGTASLWFDEAFTVIASRADIVSILRGGADPVLPPLYFVALHVWQQIAGESELAVRSLSAMFSLLAVAGIYGLTTRLFDRRTGVAAAAMMAVAPFQIYYAQEARPYALCVLLSVGLAWSFVVAVTARHGMTRK